MALYAFVLYVLVELMLTADEGYCLAQGCYDDCQDYYYVDFSVHYIL